jgi:hypothetical protein
MSGKDDNIKEADEEKACKVIKEKGAASSPSK